MDQEHPQPHWQVNWLKPPLFWKEHAIRPAEIGGGLCKVMMAQGNVLEDANYLKVVPNLFVVELSPGNYAHQYEPIRRGLLQQWHDRLVEHLMTANSRLGRKEYRFGGPLQIELRPAPDVKDAQARILSRVESDFGLTGRSLVSGPLASGPGSPQAGGRGKAAAYLELVTGDRRWPLFAGDNTIGRDEACDIYLDLPLVKEKRLVSAVHAILRLQGERCTVFDGNPSGKASANGTFVNSQRIPASGLPLQDGDILILAALNPGSPRWDTPGVAAFRFRSATPDR